MKMAKDKKDSSAINNEWNFDYQEWKLDIPD